MSERKSATGSCTRCRAGLDLASVRIGGEWYCRASCASGDTVQRPNSVSEEALTNRPRRHFARRDAKELRRPGA